jgi:hypothetical protein
MIDAMEQFIAENIERWRDEFHFAILWDRQPIDVQSIKHDMPDDKTLATRREFQQRIRHELTFIAYDCS